MKRVLIGVEGIPGLQLHDVRQPEYVNVNLTKKEGRKEGKKNKRRKQRRE
jgi:hypothetical protein